MTVFKDAFGFSTRFLHESGQYGELNTGETVHAFASHAMGGITLDGEYQKADLNALPFGVELAFVTDDVVASYAAKVSTGAVVSRNPPQNRGDK